MSIPNGELARTYTFPAKSVLFAQDTAHFSLQRSLFVHLSSLSWNADDFHVSRSIGLSVTVRATGFHRGREDTRRAAADGNGPPVSLLVRILAQICDPCTEYVVTRNSASYTIACRDSRKLRQAAAEVPLHGRVQPRGTQ